MRCKFRATSVRHVASSWPAQSKAEQEQEEVVLSAVSGPENAPWSRYTPYGELKLTITNDKTFGEIKGGQDYYIDIISVENI